MRDAMDGRWLRRGAALMSAGLLSICLIACDNPEAASRREASERIEEATAILHKLASDRFRKLHQKQVELRSYQHARANAAARAQREAENLERLKAEQAEEHRQALASMGLTPEKAAQMDAARKAAHDARITAQQERRAKEAERLAALQAEAEAEAAALINGGKATKK